MSQFRYVLLIGGVLVLLAAFGFIFRVPFITQLWPWPDGPLSYLFIGSIFAATSASLLWIGWTNELGALPGGTLNITAIGVAACIYFLQLYFQRNHPILLIYGILSLLLAIASVVTFFWSRQIPLKDSHPTPQLARASFWIFAAALLLAAFSLILKLPIFPWTLNPDSSVIFGCIFIGNACYFIYGILFPRWHNALGQLLSFLAYDLVLIGPFLALFKTVQPEHLLSLIIYVIVLLYSGGLAIYYLIKNPKYSTPN